MTSIYKRNFTVKDAPPKIHLLKPVKPERKEDALPVFFLPAFGGSCQCYENSLSLFSEDQPTRALKLSEKKGESLGFFKQIETMGLRLVDAIRLIQSKGPYFLVGWGYGGILAFETAVQLERLGLKVSSLVMIEGDKPFSNFEDLSNINEGDAAALLAKDLARERGFDLIIDPRILNTFLLQEQAIFIRNQLRKLITSENQPVTAPNGSLNWDLASIEKQLIIYRYQIDALKNYNPAPFSGKLVWVKTKGKETSHHFSEKWKAVAKEGMDTFHVDGDFYSMLKAPHANSMVQLLTYCMDRNS